MLLNSTVLLKNERIRVIIDRINFFEVGLRWEWFLLKNCDKGVGKNNSRNGCLKPTCLGTFPGFRQFRKRRWSHMSIVKLVNGRVWTPLWTIPFAKEDWFFPRSDCKVLDKLIIVFQYRSTYLYEPYTGNCHVRNDNDRFQRDYNFSKIQ